MHQTRIEQSIGSNGFGSQPQRMCRRQLPARFRGKYQPPLAAAPGPDFSAADVQKYWRFALGVSPPRQFPVKIIALIKG